MTPPPPATPATPPPGGPIPSGRLDVNPHLDLSVGFGGTGYRSPLPADVPSNLDLSAGVGRTGETPGGRAAPSDGAARGLPTGFVLADRYEVRTLLGMGGMGAVYRVFDTVRKTEVALKVMLPSLLAREKAVERFVQEAETSLKLSHEGIVRVFDVNADKATGLRFFTMELLEGMTLRQWLEEKKKLREAVRPEEALEVVRQLLEALKYAHETTVHRDLKPENVFVLAGERLRVKILDFGIAKLQTASQFTSTSMALGTAYYMAPEQQLDAAKVDRRADLYSVSVILYEMLTGELPVGAFRKASEERKGLPPALDDVILRGLQRKPEGRPPSADALLAEVRKIRDVLERGGGARVGRRTLAIAGAAVVLLLAAALIYVKSGNPGSPSVRPSLRASGGERGVEGSQAPAPRIRFADLSPATREVLRDDPVRVKGRIEGEAVRYVEVDGVQAAVARDGTFEVPLKLREGTIPLKLVAFGSTDERLGEAEHVVAIDRTAPVLDVEPADGHVTRAATIALRGTVTDASALTVLVDGAGVAVRDGRFEDERPLAGSEATFEIVARDLAGNETRLRRRIIVDRTPPVIQVESPADGAATNEATARIQGRVEDANPAHVAIRGQRVEIAAGGGFEATVPLVEGANEIAIVAHDESGNASTPRTLRVERDSRAPVVNLASPPAQAPESGRLTVAGDVDEDGCRVTVNGASATVRGKRFEVEIALQRGENAIAVVAIDRAGNESRATGKTRYGELGWSDEPLPKGMRRGREKPVLVYDTGKGLEIEMVYVPPGEFVMGAEDGDSDEKPRHTHPMAKGYFIGRYETTWKEYRAFCKAAGRAEPSAPRWGARTTTLS